MLSLMTMFFGLEHVMAQSDAGEPVKGVVRVKFQREVADRIASVAPFANGGVVKTGVEPLDNTGGKLKVVQMKRVFPYSPKFEEKHRKYGLDLYSQDLFFPIAHGFYPTVRHRVPLYIRLHRWTGRPAQWHNLYHLFLLLSKLFVLLVVRLGQELQYSL